MHLCECGCGLEVKEGNRFIHGHNSRGRPVSDETRKKIGDAHRGEKNHMFGKVTSDETKKKISESKMGIGKSAETRLRMSVASKGTKNNSWKGGISFEPYCPKFTEKLKQRIRDQYGNCDFFSGLPDNICNVVNGIVRKLAVHHIDYNKMQGYDDIRWGLIPLPHSNHTKTNFNRSFWDRLIYYALDYDKTYYNLDGGV